MAAAITRQMKNFPLAYRNDLIQPGSIAIKAN